MSQNGHKMSGNGLIRFNIIVQEMSGNLRKCQEMSGNVRKCQEMSGNFPNDQEMV